MPGCLGRPDTTRFSNQIGVYTTKGNPPAYVATFSSQSGYLDSGMGFAATRGTYINGMTLNDADKFAVTLSQHGYGVGRSADYVRELVGVIDSILTRSNCP